MLGDAAAFEERLLRRRPAEELGEVVQDLADAARREDEVSIALPSFGVERVLLETLAKHIRREQFRPQIAIIRGTCVEIGASMAWSRRERAVKF